MICITGGTGMVGAHIAVLLLKQGVKVRLLRRKSSSDELLKRILKDDVHLLHNVEWAEGDLTDLQSLDAFVEDASVVIHAAALVSFDPSDAKQLLKINTEGTANIVNCCANKHSSIYFVCISSVATLGRSSEEEFITEDSQWVTNDLHSGYAVSKYGGEREVWRAFAEGMNGVVVNPSVVIGRGKWNEGSARIFMQAYHNFPFYTKGITGIVDVRDVAEAVLFLINKKITGERFILNGENISYQELLNKIAVSISRKKPTIRVSPVMGEVAWRLEKLKSIITQRRPFITRETAWSAQQQFRYSAAKIEKIGFHFRPADKTIAETAAMFLEDIN